MPIIDNSAALPSIDEVEIVDISKLDANRVNQYMQLASDAPCVRLTGAVAAKIAKLFQELPSGEAARCHTPPFGLRFYSEKKLLSEVSICWECSNIFGHTGELPISYEFDAAAVSSRELLSLCEQAFKADEVS